MELEEKQSVSSLLQVVEEVELKKKDEKMTRFISASFGKNTALILIVIIFERKG